MMRKNIIRTTCLLSFLLLGALYSASINVKQTEALPITEYQAEYLLLNTTIWSQIARTNQTIQPLYILAAYSNLNDWNGHMLQLKSQLSSINMLYKTLPYNMFTMDILLRKYDIALQYAINATIDSNGYQIQVYNYVVGICGAYTQKCLQLVHLSNIFASMTDGIEKDVLAIGSLFTKAKLEFLEIPTLNCFPRLVAVGKTVSCHGSRYSPNAPTTAIFQDSGGKNTTAQMTPGTDGLMTANSFFDVFFDVLAPSTAGSYKLILEQTGSPGINSFFDVFVEVTVSPTILEPTTIIPITVLIAAIATLAVASKRVRRPV